MRSVLVLLLATAGALAPRHVLIAPGPHAAIGSGLKTLLESEGATATVVADATSRASVRPARKATPTRSGV